MMPEMSISFSDKGKEGKGGGGDGASEVSVWGCLTNSC